MDLQSKHRLIGAVIWLTLLVIIVPAWYSNPVNFTPDGQQERVDQASLPIVEHAYRLPDAKNSPVSDTEKKRLQRPVDEDDPQAEHAGIATNPEELIKPEFNDIYSDNAKYQGQWVVRLQAFNNTEQANALAVRLSTDYPVYIKYFAKTKVYSVRTGPYISELKAEKDKQKLDKMLRINAEVRQLP